MLQSQLFAGDELLQDIADETGERISRTRHTPSASVGRIQTALLTWRADVLPQFGVDNKYGNETAGAVRTFKIDELGVDAADAVDDVGPRTVIRLDEIQKAFEDAPGPEPDPDPDPDPVTNVRVRRDIWKLQPVGNVWHPIVLAYALGVQRMKKNLATDPTAWHWTYQSDVHGMANPTDATFVSQCQHFTSLFLPWHRMYLSVFEKVLIDIIATLPDVDDQTKTAWALPYWDYDRTDSNKLPPAFRETKLPDGSVNPLREENRLPKINSGEVGATSASTTAQFWFAEQVFQVAQGPSFGGPSIGRHHPIGGAPPGSLENVPHNAVHGVVGGLMNFPNTAALDPIFWLHHANIDRCWEIWRQNTGAGNDPDNAPPWSDTTFRFHTTDPNTDATFAPSQVMDTATDLQYTYEDTSVPASAGVVPGGPFMAVAQNPGDRPLQRIGAIDEALHLVDAGSQTVSVALEDVAPVVAAIGAPHRVVLMLEHVTVDGVNVPNYGAYVHPMGDAGEEVLVGVLTFFGPAQEGDGQAPDYTFAFDLTDIVARLTEVDKWDPDRVTFNFHPLDEEWVAAAREEGSIPTVTIGSVGLSIQ